MLCYGYILKLPHCTYWNHYQPFQSCDTIPLRRKLPAYLALCVVSGEDALAKLAALLVWPWPWQAPAVATGATPSSPPLVLLLQPSTVHLVVVVVSPGQEEE